MSFNDFVHKYIYKNEASSKIKIHQVLSSLSLIDIGSYLRDRPFKSDTGIVNLRWFKGTHWVAYLNENYLDSYGCICPKNLRNYLNLLYNEMDIVHIQNTKNKV